MKTILPLTILLSAGACLGSTKNPCLDDYYKSTDYYELVKRRGTFDENNKMIVIENDRGYRTVTEVHIYTDSGWKNKKETNDAALKRLQEEITKQDLPSRLKIVDETQATRQRRKGLFLPKNYPAVIVYDYEGQPLLTLEGVDLEDTPTLLAQIKKGNALRKRIAAFSSMIATSSYVHSHQLLMTALDTLSLKDAKRHRLLDQLKEFVDEEDSQGMLSRYTFNFVKLQDLVLKHLGKKDYKGFYAYYEKQMAKPYISVYERQVLTAALFNVKRKETNYKDASAHLLKVVELDPISDMGKGAKAYYERLHAPIALKDLKWKPEDNRSEWTTYEIDLASHIKNGGAYTFRFKREQGTMHFRQPEFVADGKITPVNVKSEKLEGFSTYVPDYQKTLTLRMEGKAPKAQNAAGTIQIIRL